MSGVEVGDSGFDPRRAAGGTGPVTTTPALDPRDDGDRLLLEQVHPPGWINPSPASRYHLVVVGGGTAGLVAASGAAGLGARVAVVERERLGGLCLNTGCVPSKTLLRAAHLAHATRHGMPFGLGSRDPLVDFPAVMSRVRQVRLSLAPHDGAAALRERGVDVFLASARFAGPSTVLAGAAALRFDRAVVCTGSRAAIPDIPGLAEAGYLTNETIFEIHSLPRRLAVIGGGPLGCELAQAFQRLGSQVTILEASSHLMGREDADVAEVIGTAFRREGMSVHTGAQVVAVSRLAGGGRLLEFRDAGGASTVEVDEILVGAGRAPNVENLGLESAGIRFDHHGITVDDRLRTSNRRVWAAGDVALKHRFTHTADASARLVLRNALFGGRRAVSALTIPWCTYTDPEVAHVGLGEDEARLLGRAVDVWKVPLDSVDRAITDDSTAGFVKVLTAAGGQRILGAVIVAPHAGESIGEIVLAMREKAPFGSLADVIRPYPTVAQGIGQAADLYNRSRLTPRVATFIRSWLRLRFGH